MNTFLSSAQEALREQYQAYAREHVAPLAAALEDRSCDLKKLLQELGQSGYLGLTVPKEYGGGGQPFISVVLFAEAVAKFDPGLALVIAGHTQAIELIACYGTDTQKSRCLPLLARGEWVGAIAMSEASAGTDVKAVESHAVEAGGKLSLTGKKTWVVNAEIASLIVVLAKSGDGGLSLYLVEPGGSAGASTKPEARALSISANRQKLGLRSAPTNDIEFTELPLASESRVGEGTTADEQIAFVADIGKTIVAAAALGLVDSAIGHSVEHAKTRQQFGKPIGQFQGIQWKLADMETESAAARLLTYRAAWSKDESSSDLTRFAAMSKLFASRVARVHSGEFVQILGSLGISDDGPAEQSYRDAKVMEIAEGTSEYQKVILVGELGI